MFKNKVEDLKNHSPNWVTKPIGLNTMTIQQLWFKDTR